MYVLWMRDRIVNIYISIYILFESRYPIERNATKAFSKSRTINFSMQFSVNSRWELGEEHKKMWASEREREKKGGNPHAYRIETQPACSISYQNPYAFFFICSLIRLFPAVAFLRISFSITCQTIREYI